MKVAVVFVLSLCLFLSKGYDYVYAGTYQQVNHPPTFQHSEKTPLSSSVAKHADLSDANDFLIDVEDEEEEVVFARKYVLLTKFYEVFVTAFVVNQFDYYSKERSLFYSYLSNTSSCKYLTQRVLRI